MSLTSHATERDKYYNLLQLAQAQITALELDDMFEFDRVLGDKDILIKSFGHAFGTPESDPVLAGIVTQIQDRDKAAMRLLFEKLGRLRRQASELNQYQTARAAYGKSNPRAGSAAATIPNNSPRFIDRKL